MPTEIILPRVDMDMASGTIAKWYAKDGDAIEKGALLFDLETSKVAMEIEAPASGNLHGLKAAIGEDIPVGQVLASNYTHYEVHMDVQAPASSNRPAPAIASNGARQAAAPSTDAKADGHSSSHSNGVRATPLARRLARERGIELASLTGLGPNGRIGRADLDQAAAATPRPAPKTSSVATIPVAALAARQHAPHHRQPAGREQGHGTALLPDGGLQPRKAAGRAPGAERSRAKRRTGRLQIVRKRFRQQGAGAGLARHAPRQSPMPKGGAILNHDCSSIGFITFDALCWPVTQIPPNADTYFIDDFTLAVSGAAGTAVIAAAKMGLSSMAIGGIGEDLIGDWVLRRLADFNVNASCMQRIKSGRASSSIVTTRPDGARPASPRREGRGDRIVLAFGSGDIFSP